MFDTVRDTLEREAKDIESAKINMSAGNRLLREKKLKLQQLNSYMDADVSRCKHTHVYLISAWRTFLFKADWSASPIG